MSTNPPRPIKLWLTRMFRFELRMWASFWTPANTHVCSSTWPNPWKTIFLLEELGVNYETESFSFAQIKEKPFTDVNPNGRVPAIEDPNTDLTLWESGAISQYLIEQHDVDHRLSYETFKERHLCDQWLHFQVSGQGPYYGQCGWFRHLHPERIPSAMDRYDGEIKRVLGVLETVLASKPADAQWLVGNKMTYADMAFVPYNCRMSELMEKPWDEIWEGAPHVRAWHQRMIELPSWKRSMEIRARLMDEQGLQWNGVPKGIDTFTDYEKQIAADKAESQ